MRISTSALKNTAEFTSQVLPNSKAICTTALVSSSMNAAPRKNILTLIGRPAPLDVPLGMNNSTMVMPRPPKRTMDRSVRSGISRSLT
jgi:hypothetical protein